MINNYLSFDSFEKKDLEDFLNLLPRDLLVIPISKKKKYGKEVGIKGFRPESYQLSVIIRIYIKEITTEKRNSFLGYNLLAYADMLIKKDLDDKDYKLLSEKNYTPDELKGILNKLFDKKSINSKYLLLMLGLTNEQNENYINVSLNELKSEFNIQTQKKDEEIKKLKNEIKNLSKKFNENKLATDKLQKENNNLTKIIQKKDDDNIILKNKLDEISTENHKLNEELEKTKKLPKTKKEILKEISQSTSKIDYKQINTLYQNLNIQDFENYISIIHEIKLEFINKKDFETLSNVIFIEYILTKIKEIEENGKK